MTFDSRGWSFRDGYVELFAGALGTSEVRTRNYAQSGHLVAADHDRAGVAATVAAFVASRAQPPVEP